MRVVDLLWLCRGRCCRQQPKSVRVNVCFVHKFLSAIVQRLSGMGMACRRTCLFSMHAGMLFYRTGMDHG